MTAGEPAPQEEAVLEPLVQRSTPSKIADRVRGAIGRGDFAPGAQLYEAELARQLGVSRGPLREGLQRLTQEGLLTSIRNRGLFVVELTERNVRDMYLAREAVERRAAWLVTRDDSEGTGAALHEVLSAMARAAEAGDSHQVAELDIRFHEVLVARTGSERLMRIHRTEATEARVCVHALGTSYENDLARVREHRAIADAVTAGDAELVDRLLMQHMADAVEELVSHAP